MEEINVATTTGIVQRFIQDDINHEIVSLLLENVHAKTIITKLDGSADPKVIEAKEFLYSVVKNNFSRIDALQSQVM